jgi:hypothetical protein
MSSPFVNLCYTTYSFRLKKLGVKDQIFDEIRKKWLVCTPEEWVRQNLIKFLIDKHSFPVNLVALEKSLIVAGRNYRFDALVFDREFNPLMIIECKAPSVKLEQKVFDQIWNYNYEINAPFFLITNGLNFVMGECKPETGIKFFPEVMNYDQLI